MGVTMMMRRRWLMMMGIVQVVGLQLGLCVIALQGFAELDITLSVEVSLPVALVDAAIAPAPVYGEELPKGCAPSPEPLSNGSVSSAPLILPPLPSPPKSRGFTPSSSPPIQVSPPPDISSTPPSYFPPPVMVLPPAPSSTTLSPPPPLKLPPSPPPSLPLPLEPPSRPPNPPPPLNLPPPPPYSTNDTGTFSPLPPPPPPPPPRKDASVPPESSPGRGAGVPGPNVPPENPGMPPTLPPPPTSDHRKSHASPPQTEHEMPRAPPPKDIPRPLPSMQQSPREAPPSHKILPHMVHAPAPSHFSPRSRGYITPAAALSPEGHIDAQSPTHVPGIHSSRGSPISSPSPTSSGKNDHSRKKIIYTPLPPSHSIIPQSAAPPVLPPEIVPEGGGSTDISPPPMPEGSPVFSPHLASPPLVEVGAPAPSPTTEVGSGSDLTFVSSPKGSPISPKPPPPMRPIFTLPPPPPNDDCLSTTCMDPYTNTPPGSPCGCVWPMQVGLGLNVPLYTFFPLVSELAQEIALGVFMNQSQVRIMGANAASEQPDKTIVLVDLVPLEQRFNSTTALQTFERFWHKDVVINTSKFGDYQVLYVRYPGLPPSPPLPPSDVGIIDGGPFDGNGGRTNKPLGVYPLSRPHINGLSPGVIAIIVLSALVAVTLFSVVVRIVVLKRRELVVQQGGTPRALLPSVGKSTGNTAGSVLGSRHSSASLSFGSSIPNYPGSAKTFSTAEMERATDNFDDSRVLGEGGFGRVYSGILEDGTKVAVKVLKRDDQQGGREFLAEVEMLSRLHHRNLVKLIGICTEERLRCLVYELIPNGSVESHLHGVDKETAPLNWEARMKIALGRKPVDMSQPPGQENLVAWARPLLTSREGLESMLDPSLGPDIPFDSVAKVAAIASMCVQLEVSHRPFMGEVVQALKLVCNEGNEPQGGEQGSGGWSREDPEIDLGMSQRLHLPDPSTSRYLDPHFDSPSRAERGISISISELLGTASARYGGWQASESFRRHSSSGPLRPSGRMGRGRNFWQRLKRLSGGSASEHPIEFRLWTGSQ
ncbi:hypothetical protein MLD38_015370 [Melastoma candidum]|uniref:Uncharacterized protein n=1 Tax=Melastoma candidum TaxID=119954 RepID=A0ACB9RK26_9MYRT|nr:hypothetical protein MLD38_015370 [Melastoma candidum]